MSTKANCTNCGTMLAVDERRRASNLCDACDPDMTTGPTEPKPVRSVRDALELCVYELVTLAPRLREPYRRSVLTTIAEAKRSLQEPTP